MRKKNRERKSNIIEVETRISEKRKDKHEREKRMRSETRRRRIKGESVGVQKGERREKESIQNKVLLGFLSAERIYKKHVTFNFKRRKAKFFSPRVKKMIKRIRGKQESME